MRFTILTTPQTSPKARMLLRCLAKGSSIAKVDVQVTHRYVADVNEIIMLYGMGGRDRLQIVQQHQRKGGRVVVWDLGYWDRKLPYPDRKYRVSIDGMHPPQFVMRGDYPGSDRWDQSALTVTKTGHKYGPILLAGNGPKSNAIGALGWTAQKSIELRSVFPGKQIFYRPKPKKPRESGVDHDGVSDGPIEEALSISSLVVCRHSNVAVDACRAGVPVVCDDGAAAAIYPKRLQDVEKQPGSNTRLEFLHRLAWWQWSPNECSKGLVWPWLIEVLNGGV